MKGNERYLELLGLDEGAGSALGRGRGPSPWTRIVDFGQDAWQNHRTVVYIGAGSLTLFTLLTLFKKQVVTGATVSWDAVKVAALKAAISSLPKSTIHPAALQYVDSVIYAADKTGMGVFQLLAIGQHETLWGEAAAMKPKGPGGTGDWTARKGAWLQEKGVRIVNTLPPGWGAAKGSVGPWAIPSDGLGWGRGLMQVDFLASLNFDWKDPLKNIVRGAEILKGKMAYLAATPKTPTLTIGDTAAKSRGVAPGTYKDPRPLTGSKLLEGSIAAYNTGELNVLRSLAVGVPADKTTTGGNYSADVLSKGVAVAGAFKQAGGVA
jgi:hypothetical protein